MNNPLRHWDGSEFIQSPNITKPWLYGKGQRHKIFDAAKEPTFSDSILSIESDYIEDSTNWTAVQDLLKLRKA